MTDFVRRAGTGRLPDGSRIIWSLAEGGRGRRWREVRYAGASVISSLLLEADPDGRFLHLEASTAAGLITLHPEPDATLHGNVVSAERVEPVRGLSWSAEAIVVLEGSPISQAAAALRLRRSMPDFSTRSVTGVFIPLTLWLDPKPIPVERVAPDGWRFQHGEVITFDSDGIPYLPDGETWPLEEG